MHNKVLFDVEINKNYMVVGFIKSDDFIAKPFNNIGLYIGKEFYLHDIKYNKKMFFIVIDKVEYAIRGTDTKYICIKENN